MSNWYVAASQIIGAVGSPGPTGPITYDAVMEDSAVGVLMRVMKGASAATQSDFGIGTITYSVKDLTAGTMAITDTALTVSTVIQNSLQTDAQWVQDTTGYNFTWNVPGTAFPTAGHVYAIQVRFLPASDNSFWGPEMRVTTVENIT